MATGALLSLTREQILAFRRHAGALEQRLAPGATSLRTAAWAGLQDSMPRAALLSLHARVRDVTSDAWADPSLVQVWGPRYSAYVVAERDRAIFTLARLPEARRGRERAQWMAAALREHLADSALPYDDVGRALGIDPNALRYGASTGTVLIRWDGARRPLVWCVDAPELDPADARRELARRFLHVFGPSTDDAFARWAGIPDRDARDAFSALAGELIAVRTPIGESWILAADESTRRGVRSAPAPVRLLPSGDALFLCHGRERELLVPDRAARAELWTPRVWPGAVLRDGEIRGIWRRAGATVTVHLWGRVSREDRAAVEGEAATLPLPGLDREISVTWS